MRYSLLHLQIPVISNILSICVYHSSGIFIAIAIYTKSKMKWDGRERAMKLRLLYEMERIFFPILKSHILYHTVPDARAKMIVRSMKVWNIYIHTCLHWHVLTKSFIQFTPMSHESWAGWRAGWPLLHLLLRLPLLPTHIFLLSLHLLRYKLWIYINYKRVIALVLLIFLWLFLVLKWEWERDRVNPWEAEAVSSVISKLKFLPLTSLLFSFHFFLLLHYFSHTNELRVISFLKRRSSHMKRPN